MAPLLQVVASHAGRASSWNLLAQPSRVLSLVEPPSGPEPDPVVRAAVEAEERAKTDCRLDDIWQDHLCGRLRAGFQTVGSERILFITRVSDGSSPVGPDDANILARVLWGEQQKVVACELGVAPSTVSGRYVRALDKLDLTPSTVPVLLILAAQTWVGTGGGVPTAKRAFFESAGRAFMVISLPRPVVTRMATLTPAEQEVAKGIIEGCSRFEIARRRRTSVYTVARQYHAIFNKQHVTGRCGLIRCAADLQGFR